MSNKKKKTNISQSPSLPISSADSHNTTRRSSFPLACSEVQSVAATARRKLVHEANVNGYRLRHLAAHASTWLQPPPSTRRVLTSYQIFSTYSQVRPRHAVPTGADDIPSGRLIQCLATLDAYCKMKATTAAPHQTTIPTSKTIKPTTVEMKVTGSLPSCLQAQV